MLCPAGLRRRRRDQDGELRGRFSYPNPGNFPGIYKAAAKWTVTRNGAGQVILVSSPTVSMDAVTQPAGMKDSVTVVTFNLANTVWLSAAGVTGSGNYVSCGAHKAAY